MKAGDLVLLDGDYFLCLGKTLSFEELYLTVPTLRSPSYLLVYKSFLSPLTLSLLHWMVATYYTTYKVVVKHFVSEEIESLLKREGKMKKKGKEEGGENGTKSDKVGEFVLAEKGQTLIVFPDLWTMTNMIPQDVQNVSE